MEIIGEIVKNVAVIALLAVIAELLLPGEEMGRYVRLIMGLFVIVSVLTPLLSTLERRVNFEVTAWSMPSRENEWQKIKNQGAEVASKAEEVVLKEYRKKVAGQIEAMASLVSGVAWAKAEVAVATASGPQWGSLERVALMIGKKESTGGKEPALALQAPGDRPAGQSQELKKRDPADGREEEKKLRVKVEETILNFYALKPGQLEVRVLEGGVQDAGK